MTKGFRIGGLLQATDFMRNTGITVVSFAFLMTFTTAIILLAVQRPWRGKEMITRKLVCAIFQLCLIAAAHCNCIEWTFDSNHELFVGFWTEAVWSDQVRFCGNYVLIM